MISNNKLDVFENFQINRKPKEAREDRRKAGMFLMDGVSGATVLRVSNPGFSFVPPFKSWLDSFMTRLFNPNSYFNSIKLSMQEIQIEPTVQAKIKQMQGKAKQARQTALVEQLERENRKIEKEVLLVAAGLNIAIDEETVVLLSLKAPKIHLTWIKNFLRPIPEDVQVKFQQADESELFDNYVIMHYGDPDGSIGETEAEVEKRKDPILFGVFKESRRLYYIADWIDEHCDLTLTKLLYLTSMQESEVHLTDDRIVNPSIEGQ